jgi:hypothetical protein
MRPEILNYIVDENLTLANAQGIKCDGIKNRINFNLTNF